MRTAEKYQEMGFMELERGKVRDKHGRVYYPKKARSPLQAIKLMCRECMGQDRTKPKRVENATLVRDCVDPMCPLFDFRMGKNPFIKGRSMSEEEKMAARERMTLLREQGKI